MTDRDLTGIPSDQLNFSDLCEKVYQLGVKQGRLLAQQEQSRAEARKFFDDEYANRKWPIRREAEASVRLDDCTCSELDRPDPYDGVSPQDCGTDLPADAAVRGGA